MQPVVDRQTRLAAYLLLTPDCRSVKIMERVVDLECWIINDPTDDADFRHEPVGASRVQRNTASLVLITWGRFLGGSNRGNEILEGRNPRMAVD